MSLWKAKGYVVLVGIAPLSYNSFIVPTVPYDSELAGRPPLSFLILHPAFTA